MTNMIGRTDAPEIERLREEVKKLSEERRVRRLDIGSWVALGIGIVVSIAATLAVFVDQTLLDTDEYVATVSELALEPAIVQAATKVVVDDLVDREAVTSEIQSLLPDDLQFAAIPLVSGLESGVQELAVEIAGTAEFGTIWSEANRLAHQEAVAVLRGQGTEPFVIEDGRVTLDLSELARPIASALGPDASSLIQSAPGGGSLGQVTLLRDNQLAGAQTAVRILDATALVLPVVAVLLLLLGAWIGRDRRRYAIRAGISLAVGLLVVVALLDVVRAEATGSLNGEFGPALTAVFDVIATRFTTQTLVVAAVALVVAAVAAVIGSDAASAALRARLGQDARGRSDWLTEHRRAVLWALGVVVLVVLLVWPSPTVGVVFLIATASVGAFGLIQLSMGDGVRSAG